MALRNQPYLPLYVNDFSNDLNVKRCSSSSVGVYIMLMCVLHQSHEYGILILRKNEKKYPDQVKNFATLLIKLMPFDIIEIEAALNELLDNEVLKLDGDKLIQKRMVKDGIISDKRSKAGKKGGEKTRDKARFAQAKADQTKSPDLPPPEDENNIDPLIEEKKEKLITNIVEKFNYTSHQNKKQQSMIMSFVNSLPFHGKLDFLIIEFESYKKLKEIDQDRYLHTIENFIGTQSKQYSDGAWDDNWTEKLKKHKTKTNGNTIKSGTEGARSNVNPTPKRSFRKQL